MKKLKHEAELVKSRDSRRHEVRRRPGMTAGLTMEDDGMTDIVIYEGPDGTVEVRLDRETVWLRQEQMS